jgi:hypothetical protein
MAEPIEDSRPAQSKIEDQELKSSLRRWLTELADADPAVREQARLRLMDMPPGQLDAFREVVQVSRPLMPSQATVLRDIVVHVFLRSQQYTSDATSGWLGVTLTKTSVPDLFPAGDRADPASESLLYSVVETKPGFCAFPRLQSGDVIVGLKLPDGRAMDASAPLDDGMPIGLIATIQALPGGQVVQLAVLRQGKVIEITLTLDARPIDIRGRPLLDVLRDRERESSHYWQETFGPLVWSSAT